MQKLLELIEQVRFAELKKIDTLSSAREAYMNESIEGGENPSN
ncbi:hypothetical protein [Lutimonas sp.]